MQRVTLLPLSHAKVAYAENSEERFLACADYIRRHGKLMGPIIGVAMLGGLMIVDEHHRLAALLWLRRLENAVILAWIGAALPSWGQPVR